MDLELFEARKRDHIQQALAPSNQAQGFSKLDRVRLRHEAAPEIDFKDVTLQATRLGQVSPTPFFVPAMTAGHLDAKSLNRTIARACQERGWAMGLGSQRRDLDAPASSVDGWAAFRKEFPKLTLFGNLGASQLVTTPLDSIERLADETGAQAWVIHFNALQEAIQPEGTPQFRGVLAALDGLVNRLKIPVIAKETGCGFSLATLKKFQEIGLGAVDVSGLGGTHWGRIEGARAADASLSARLADTFAQWGESTVDSVLNAAELQPRWEIWASGGVRNGLDAAKLIALGSHQIGMAQPVLRAAIEGDESVQRVMHQVEAELKTALFCMGCATVESLRGNASRWEKI